MHKLLILISIILVGCSSGSNESDGSGVSIAALNGTTWYSTKCEIGYGFHTTHTINFTESRMVYEYSYYEDSDCENVLGILFIEARPYSFGVDVITSTGLTATKLITTRNSTPQYSLDFEYTYDEVDYLNKSGNSLYFSIKDIINNCNIYQEVSSPPVVRVGACIEWNATLDFEQIYYQQI